MLTRSPILVIALGTVGGTNEGRDGSGSDSADFPFLLHLVRHLKRL